MTLRLEAINHSPAPVDVLASTRLPYVLFEHGRAVVLYGVNDPDPDYYGIEIPLSRPLAPDEHLVQSRALGANIAFGVAAGLAIGVGVLWFTGASEMPAHHVAVAPALAPGEAGIVAFGWF